MKFNLITLIISLVILIATIWARQALVVDASTHSHYYVTAILLISSIITVITLLRWLLLRHRRLIFTDGADQKASDRHRLHYRLKFDQSPHPLFVQRTDERHPVTTFTCPVRDISETGISLGCKGVYVHGQSVQGEIIFGSGRTAPVNGVVIREETDRTCLRLHCTIDPPLLMAEQREQIALEKGNSSRPGVSKTVLDSTAGSLPSHSPKGICRLKRP